MAGTPEVPPSPAFGGACAPCARFEPPARGSNRRLVAGLTSHPVDVNSSGKDFFENL